jgi:hypothetical protein
LHKISNKSKDSFTLNKRIKIVLLIALIFLSLNSFCQLAQGSIFLRGDIGYSSINNSYSYNQSGINSSSYNIPVPNTNQIGIVCTLGSGYFISNNLVGGLYLSYLKNVLPQEVIGYNNIYYTWNNTTESLTYGIYIIKYIKITESFYLSGGLAASLIAGKTTNSFLYNYQGTGYSSPKIYPFPNQPMTGYEVAFAPALDYMPSSNWMLGFKLNNIIHYSSETTKNFPVAFNYSNNPTAIITENHTVNTFNVGAGLAPTIEIAYIFVKKSDKISTN